MGLIRKAIIKFVNWLTGPQRIEKLKTTADFHKRCEYHQSAIELMFDNGVFDLENGNATIHKDHHGKIRKIEINQVAWRE